MIAMNGQHARLGEEGGMPQPGPIDGVSAEGDVDLAVEHRLADLPPAEMPELKVEIGHLGDRGSDDAGGERACGIRPETEPKERLSRPDSSDPRGELVTRGHHVTRHLDHFLTGGG